jgi:anti-sigma factor RsiW
MVIAANQVSNLSMGANLRNDLSSPMTCRDIEPLLLAERDGVLTTAQHASLDQHVAACPPCRELRARLTTAMTAFRADATNVAMPDIEDEWQKLRVQLRSQEPATPVKKRSLAPVIWFGAPLAAAAALALAYFNQQPQSKPTDPISPATEVAQAEYVEAGDAGASTMVYVDKESGWLVVWASDGDSGGKG